MPATNILMEAGMWVKTSFTRQRSGTISPGSSGGLVSQPSGRSSFSSNRSTGTTGRINAANITQPRNFYPGPTAKPDQSQSPSSRKNRSPNNRNTPTPSSNKSLNSLQSPVSSFVSTSDNKSDASDLAMPFCRLTDAQEWEEAESRNPEGGKWISPFIVSSLADINTALAAARVGPHDIVADLGSGDGRALTAAIKYHHAFGGLGVEVNPSLIERAKREAKRVLGVNCDRVHCIESNLPHSPDPEGDEEGKKEKEQKLEEKGKEGKESEREEDQVSGAPNSEGLNPDVPCSSRGATDGLLLTQNVIDTPKIGDAPSSNDGEGNSDSLSEGSKGRKEKQKKCVDPFPLLSERGSEYVLKYNPSVTDIADCFITLNVTVVYLYLLPKQLSILSRCFSKFLNTVPNARVVTLRFPLPAEVGEPKVVVDGFSIDCEDKEAREQVPTNEKYSLPFPEQMLKDMPGRTEYKVYVYHS